MDLFCIFQIHWFGSFKWTPHAAAFSVSVKALGCGLFFLFTLELLLPSSGAFSLSASSEHLPCGEQQQSLHYKGKMHYNVVERRELDVESEISFRRQLLLMTQMKYESNECVCDWGCSHPCVVRWWITFLPPLATRWLSCWWWVASSCLSGGWWDVTVLQAAANMQPPLNPFTLPVQMSYSTIVTVRLIIPLTKQRLTSKYGLPFAPCFRNGRKPVATRVIITAYTETTGYRRRWAPDGHFLCQAGNGTELPRHHFSF